MSAALSSGQLTHTQATPYFSSSSRRSSCAASPEGFALFNTSTKGLPISRSSDITRSSAGM